MGKGAPQGLHPTMPTRPIACGEGLGAVLGLVLARIGRDLGRLMGWYWASDGFVLGV